MLSVRALTKTWDPSSGVRGVDMDMARDQRLGIIGPSGCGKTTLLHLIAGLVAPDSGTVEWQGEPGARMGLIQQKDGLFPWLSAWDNIILSPHADSDLARELTSYLAIEGLLHKYPNQLSGGERKRVSIARALCPRPALLLIDEPSSSLDAMAREQLQALILDIQTTWPMATILVTHDLEEALYLSQRLWIMNRGQLVEQIENPLYPCAHGRSKSEFYQGLMELRSLFQGIGAGEG